MLIDLHELLQEDDSRKVYHLKPETDMFEMKEVSYKIKDGDFELSFQAKEKKHITCTCKGKAILVIPCDRCLEPVDCIIDIDYFKDLDMNSASEEKAARLDEESFLEGTVFDTEVLIHNEILVNLPMKVLCKEDCKGICNRCGANLNKGSCKCDNTELDPRMSKISDIFNQFKEV